MGFPWKDRSELLLILVIGGVQGLCSAFPARRAFRFRKLFRVSSGVEPRSIP